MTNEELIAKLMENAVGRRRIEKEWDELKIELERRFRKERCKFPGLYAHLSLTYTDVKIYVYAYNQVEHLDGGGWCKSDPSDSGFGIPVENGPMPWDEYEKKVKALGESLSLSVTMVTLKQRTQGGIETIAALRVLHAGKTVTLIAKGTVMYVGWDIGDPWYTAKIGEDTWAFWGEGAHSSEIKYSAKEGTPEWERYLRLLENDGK